jgi:hypothetical protein
MDTLPSEVRLQEFWKHLSYDEIVNLCKINVEFSNVCQSNLMWQYLLDRDFDISYDGQNAKYVYLIRKFFGVIYTGEDALQVYSKYINTLNHFTQYYPIITQQALISLVNLIPVSDWPAYDKVITNERINGDTNKILSAYGVGNLASATEYYEYLTQDMRKFDNNVSNIVLDSIGGEENFYQMINQILPANCDKISEIVTRPTTIFVNGKPIIVDYDYELIEKILSVSTILNTLCRSILENMKSIYLSLLQIRI